MGVGTYESLKSDYHDGFVKNLNLVAGIKEKDESVKPFGNWVEDSHLIIDGFPFTYRRHEYLKGIYEDDHPFMAIQKGTQGGFTVRAMTGAIYGCRFRGYRGVLYLFPSRTDVSDFSKGRIDPLIQDNPETIGKWIQDTDAANIKRVWNAFLYLRGMKSRVGLKSVPADEIIFDELDEAPQNMVDMAMARMDHSEFGRVVMLSNPTMPDFGINKAFLQTDQRFWLMRCALCGTWNNLIDYFPQCLLRLKNKVIRACQKCKAELDPARGEWVAKKSEIKDKRGYQWSQLISQYPAAAPDKLLELFETTNNKRDFYNLKLGLPYVEAENRLSVEQVLALCSNQGILSSDSGPCFMGVDQGKGLHVVIGKNHMEKAGEIVHLGEYKDWLELDNLMKNFNVARAVVDAQPEMRAARSFAMRFKGRVFLNFYSDYQRGSYKWDEGDLKVTCNRTESLDASHNEILLENIILPKECDIVRTFAEHLHNEAKKLEEDEETGSKRYIYVRLGLDHFRHAQNYEAMARQHASGLLYPELL
jgi:hypothetical protein